MQAQGFEKISTNIDILQYIFELLTLDEQLKFARVSAQLQYVFTNFIWKGNYTKICIIKNPPNYNIRNDTGLNNLNLSQKEFEEFLNLYANNVKELTEKCDPALDIRKFPKLTSLSYNNMTVTKNLLQLVAKNCPRLQKLNFYTCVNKNSEMLEMGKDIEVKTILEMKNLKYLSFKIAIQMGLKYRYFQDIITKSKIKTLILKSYIQPDTKISLFNKQTANFLETLEISTTFQAKYWLKNLTTYLSHYENLVSLTLNSSDTITDDTFNTLSTTCKKLQKLSINFTKFENVKTFSKLTTLRELSIQSGDGLTYENLKEILNEMKLQKFYSVQTEYKGNFENFPISSTIKSFEFDEIHTHKFKAVYENNENLCELHWYDDYYDPVTNVSINCPNLECLFMSSGFVSIENLLELKSLHTLVLQQAMVKLTWPYILTLLRQHGSLVNLTFSDEAYSPGDLKESPDIPQEAFVCSSNLKCLTVAKDLFQLAPDFWLDLLGKNSAIQLICSGLFHHEFIQQLVGSSKFPRNLKSIQIHGFKVGCDDLRKNFDVTINKLNDDSHLPIAASYNNKYGIVF